jgi:acyl transferase domain-containing protein/acyl-CoA thioesterase FadM
MTPTPAPCPIGVVGVGLRYPGSEDQDTFWSNIVSRRREFRHLVDCRLPLDEYHGEGPDSTYATRAALLSGFHPDQKRFSINKQALATFDIVHWLALEVAVAAAVDCGVDRMDERVRERTGVIVGNTLTGEVTRAGSMRVRWPFVKKSLERAAGDLGVGREVLEELTEAMEHRFKSVFPTSNEDSLAGGLSNTIAGVISKKLGLRGLAFTVDGACASSLIAVAQGVDCLRLGSLDAVLVGGVDISLDTFELVGFARAGAMTRTDMSVYGSRADGFLPGEGCGFVCLRRLEDCDPGSVYAVLHGCGISADGEGGIMEPISAGQVLALKRAYLTAPYSPSELDFVEGHGTGTSKGDEAELSAIAELVGPSGSCAVTSLKSLIGHTKAASGIGALIKAVLAVHRGAVPPTAGLNYATVSPLFKKLPQLYPALELKAKPGGAIKAGVSGMGFGGINVHVTLASVDPGSPLARPAPAPVRDTCLAPPQDAELFLFSVRGSPAELASHLLECAEQSVHISVAEMLDLSAQLAARFEPTAFARCAIVASLPQDLVARLREAASLCENDPEFAGFIVSKVPRAFGPDRTCTLAFDEPTAAQRRTVFLFPGQGSQFAGQTRNLAKRFPAVAAAIASASPLAKRAVDEAVLFPYTGARSVEEAERLLAGTERSQLALCLSELLLLGVLRLFGVEPDAVAGHSLGELVALHAAGALPLPALFDLVGARGRCMGAAPPGAMSSVSASAERVAALLSELPEKPAGVTVSNLNSPRRTVVAGSVPALEAFERLCETKRFVFSRLNTPHAFHSPEMGPAAAAFAAEAEALLPSLPVSLAASSSSSSSATLYSTVTGGKISEPPLAASLVRHLANQITAPVLFTTCLEALTKDLPDAIFVEVGPGKAMTILSQETLGHIRCFATEPRPGGTSVDLLVLLGFLSASGSDLNLRLLYEGREVRQFVWPAEKTFIRNPCENESSARPQPEQKQPEQKQPSLQPASLSSLPGDSLRDKLVLNDRERRDLPQYLAQRGAWLAALIRNDMASLAAERSQAAAASAAITAAAAPAAGAQAVSDSATPTTAAAAAAAPQTSAAPPAAASAEDVLAVVVALAKDITGLEVPSSGDSTFASIGLDSIKRARLINDSARVVGLSPGEVNPTSDVFKGMKLISQIAAQIHTALSSGGRPAGQGTGVKARVAGASVPTSSSRLLSSHSWVESFAEILVPIHQRTYADLKGLDTRSLHNVSVFSFESARARFVVNALDTAFALLGVTLKPPVYISKTAEDPKPAYVGFISDLLVLVPADGFAVVDYLWFIASVTRFIDQLTDVQDELLRVTFCYRNDGLLPIRALAASLFLECHGAISVRCVELPHNYAGTPVQIAERTVADMALQMAVRTPTFSHVTINIEYSAALEMRRVPPPPPARALPPGPPICVLVSGGGRGITARCALGLVPVLRTRQAVTFVLTGTSPATNPEVADTLASFQGFGDHVKAVYLAADIVSAEGAAAVAAAAAASAADEVIFVHGAARNTAKNLLDLDVAEALRDIAPKVDGFKKLLAALEAVSKRPSLVVGLSSIIAVTGMYGSGVYGFANQLLEAAIKASGIRAVLLRYSHWDEVGMAARMGSNDFLENLGMAAIDLDRGVRSFVDWTHEALTSTTPVIEVVIQARMATPLPTWLFPAIAPQEKQGGGGGGGGGDAQPQVGPVAGQLVSEIEGVECFSRKEFSLRSLPALADHVISSSVIVPAVLHLEGCLAAALRVGAGKPVFPVVIKDAQFMAAVDVPRVGAETLQFSAIRCDEVVHFESRASSTGFLGVACRGSLSRATGAEEKLASVTFACTPATALPIDPQGDVYKRGILFHGPRFQTIKAVYQIAFDEASGRGSCTVTLSRRGRKAALEELTGDAIDRPDSQLVLGDPFFRDGLLQAAKLIIPKHDALPASCGSIRILDDPDCEEALCVVAMETIPGSSPASFRVDARCYSPSSSSATAWTLFEVWEGLVLSDLGVTETNPSVQDLIDPSGRDARILNESLRHWARATCCAVPAAGLAVRSGQRWHGMATERRHAIQAGMVAGALTWDPVSGQPKLPAPDHVSFTHTDHVMLGSVGRSPQGVDLASIPLAPPAAQQSIVDLFSSRTEELRHLAEGSTDCFDLSSARAWAALEAAYKATGVSVEEMRITVICRYDKAVLVSAGGVLVLTFPVRFTRGPAAVVALVVTREIALPPPPSSWDAGIAWTGFPSRAAEPASVRVREAMTFREASTLSRHVPLTFFVELLGRVREQSLQWDPRTYRAFCESFFASEETGGSVTERVSYVLHRPTTAHDIVEVHFSMSSMTTTSMTFDFLLFNVDPLAALDPAAQQQRSPCGNAQVTVSYIATEGREAARRPWPVETFRAMVPMCAPEGMSRAQPVPHGRPAAAPLPPVARPMPDPEKRLGRVVVARDPRGPPDYCHIITALPEDGNFVGNVYFSRYSQFNATAVSLWVRAVMAGGQGGEREGELFTLSTLFDFETESFPYDQLELSMRVTAIHVAGLDVMFTFRSVGGGGGSGGGHLLLTSRETLAWVRAPEPRSPSGPRELASGPLPKAFYLALGEEASFPDLVDGTETIPALAPAATETAAAAPPAAPDTATATLAPAAPERLEGWLLKRSRWTKTLNKRWCALSATEGLIFWKDEGKAARGKPPRGTIPHKDIVKVSLDTHTSFDITVRKGFTVHFEATTPALAREWVARLKP